MARLEPAESLLPSRHTCYPGYRGKAHLVILTQHMVGKSPLPFYRIGIIEIGHKEDLLYLERHQVVENIPLSIMPVEEFLQKLPARDARQCIIFLPG